MTIYDLIDAVACTLFAHPEAPQPERVAIRAHPKAFREFAFDAGTAPERRAEIEFPDRFRTQWRSIELWQDSECDGDLSRFTFEIDGKPVLHAYGSGVVAVAGDCPRAWFSLAARCASEISKNA